MPTEPVPYHWVRPQGSCSQPLDNQLLSASGIISPGAFQFLAPSLRFSRSHLPVTGITGDMRGRVHEVPCRHSMDGISSGAKEAASLRQEEASAGVSITPWISHGADRWLAPALSKRVSRRASTRKKLSSRGWQHELWICGSGIDSTTNAWVHSRRGAFLHPYTPL